MLFDNMGNNSYNNNPQQMSIWSCFKEYFIGNFYLEMHYWNIYAVL